MNVLYYDYGNIYEGCFNAELWHVNERVGPFLSIDDCRKQLEEDRASMFSSSFVGDSISFRKKQSTEVSTY